ncbi:unnamed protein product [Polarella glacialis]|uniref:EamA domain-containing protein n=2 Tax=Polarella glacialis TaxID=89957 RepID=A0A813JTF3_POLGL|nr:unnamed protein product [Polarella glacialis]
MLNCYRSTDLVEPHDYAVFVSVFDILLWAVVMSATARVGGWSSASPSFPRKALLRAAAIDQLGTLLATLGATYVPGQVQVLLNQAVLPLTMLLSLCLGRRYGCSQTLGAALVLAGAATAIGSSTLSLIWTSGSPASWEATSPAQLLGLRGLMAFCAAQLAVASAGLAKEALLKPKRGAAGPLDESKESRPSPVALGVAVAWRRVPLGLFMALALPSRAPAVLSGGGASSGAALAELWDGWRCFCGAQPRLGDEGCARAASTTLVSVALYATQTLLCLRLTQRGSATIRSIAAVTAVPVAQLLFTSEVMSGGNAEAIGPSSLAGLLLCLMGFLLYLRPA